MAKAENPEFPEFDVLWFRLWNNGPGMQVKAPWNQPLFSERYGHKKPLITFLGWRLFYLKRYVLTS